MSKRDYVMGYSKRGKNILRNFIACLIFSKTQIHVDGLYTHHKIFEKYGLPPFNGRLSKLILKSSFHRHIGFQSKKSNKRFLSELHMVLTTPDTIIEQASTQKLLDDLIDESVRTTSRKPIMIQFDPNSSSIWRRWRGTVFSETWTSCLKNMAFAFVLFTLAKFLPTLKENLQGFQVLWGQLLSVTTFTLTFFLNQSYALWRKCYSLSRRLQGRLNDLGLTLAAHASRKTTTSSSEPSTYTAASRQLLELVARYIRLFNVLCYASFTRSHRPILTPRGMRRLTERGLLTASEQKVLLDAEVPATQRHNAVIMWIVRCFLEGRKSGHFVGGSGFEQQFLEKVHVIRSVYGGVGDELQGRMPLAYAHIVQVLVDIIIWLYPLMAFSTDMTPFLGILGTGLLTLTYQGLFDLAKQFLDPYDNETYGKGDDPICVDTLVAESNSGSIRWLNSLNEMPVSEKNIRDGDLQEYQLPLRGYSVEELAQMEEEKSLQLADEDWGESEPQIVEAPLTLEDYSRKVKEVYENVEKELKETEAILNAPPGADSYDPELEEESIEDGGKEINERKAEKSSEKAVDASSEIRAEVQAAYEAAKEEEERVEQQLEMRSKNDDPLAILFDEEEQNNEISVDKKTEMYSNITSSSDVSSETSSNTGKASVAIKSEEAVVSSLDLNQTALESDNTPKHNGNK